MTSSAKVLQFPLAGISRDTDYRKAYIPSEKTAFTTPFAVNVMGECTFAERQRGGSRPGLVSFTGTQPTEASTGKWLWPNGDVVKWPDNDNMTFSEGSPEILAPDGGRIVTQHDTFTVSATLGNVPENVTSVALYRARLVVAKDSVWYASRSGDTGDFDYGGEMNDTARAAYGNTATADAKGDPITALAAVDDTWLVVATARQIRYFASDVTTSAATIASEHVGIVSRDAWCYGDGAFWFVGPNGLYGMQFGAAPQNVSIRLPEDFKGFMEATLVYDPERRGIWIFARRGNVRHDWFYAIAEKALWEMSYVAAKAPTAGYTCMIGGVNRVIFKCADGAWRYFNDDATADNGTDAIASRVAIGPLRTSKRDDMNGMLAELAATTAAGSANVTCKVYAAHSPEAAVDAAKAGGTAPSFSFSAGWNHVVRPRVRGAWVVLVLSATGRWGYESMTAICKMLGRLR